MTDAPVVPASVFDAELEAWIHTATLGGAPMRGTNLPDDIVASLQELAKDEDPTREKQDKIRDAWSQYKIDQAQQAQDKLNAMAEKAAADHVARSQAEAARIAPEPDSDSIDADDDAPVTSADKGQKG